MTYTPEAQARRDGLLDEMVETAQSVLFAIFASGMLDAIPEGDEAGDSHNAAVTLLHTLDDKLREDQRRLDLIDLAASNGWHNAKARLDAASAAERTDDDENFDKVEQEQLDACMGLVNTPAPDLPAVVEKIAVVRRQFEDFVLNDDHINPIIADLNRLAGAV